MMVTLRAPALPLLLLLLLPLFGRAQMGDMSQMGLGSGRRQRDKEPLPLKSDLTPIRYDHRLPVSPFVWVVVVLPPCLQRTGRTVSADATCARSSSRKFGEKLPSNERRLPSK